MNFLRWSCSILRVEGEKLTTFAVLLFTEFWSCAEEKSQQNQNKSVCCDWVKLNARIFYRIQEINHNLRYLWSRVSGITSFYFFFSLWNFRSFMHFLTGVCAIVGGIFTGKKSVKLILCIHCSEMN